MNLTFIDAVSDLHVGGVGLQTADDHADGWSQEVGDVPQHHAGRLGPRQDVIHEAKHRLCLGEENLLITST